MEHGTKSTTIHGLKAGAEDGLQHGEALAMISLYGVKDHDGDRVKDGGFNDFAAAVNDGELPLSLVWQHGRRPEDHIGEVMELDTGAVDDKGRAGLAAKVKFDVDSEIGRVRDNARQAYKLVKGRRVNQWSYAWDGDTKQLADGSRELSNMRLSEVSPVLRGALSETSTLAVKQLDDDADNDAADFAKTWTGIGEMIATDADLVDWFSDANGPDVAGIVQAIASYIANDVYVESMEGPDEDAGDVPYFAKALADPRVAAARAELDLPVVT